MSGTRAAIRYAKAVLSVATDNQTSGKIQLEMDQIAEAINICPDLNSALKSPVVKMSEKTAILDQLFSTSSPEVKALFKVLTKNKRIDLLELIAKEYNRLFDHLNKKEKATVTTALPMTPALQEKVMQKLKSLSTKEISLTKIVDETILGGFILRIGDQQYNASVSNQLNDLKSKFQMN